MTKIDVTNTLLKDNGLRLGIVIGSVLLVIGFWVMMHQMGIARHDDIVSTFQEMPSECRAVAAARMKMDVVRVGRPYTRGELDRLANKFTDCDSINEQLKALNG